MALLDLLKGFAGFRSEEDHGHVEPWAESDENFYEHFNVSFDEFEERLHSLDQAHLALYEKTFKVNPEAAVTWVFWISPA